MTDWVEKYHQQKQAGQVSSTEEDAKGGPGSGHWGHAGRPGKRGGSVPGSVAVSIRTGRTAAQRRGEAKYQVPELERTFATWGEAVSWIGSQGMYIEQDGTSRQMREIADTMKDIENKIGRGLPIKSIKVSKTEASQYRKDKGITINPNDSQEEIKNTTLRSVNYTLNHTTWGDTMTGYHKRLLETKELLLSGAYREGHTAYWFGNERNIEAVVRHEVGHAIHRRYNANSVVDTHGLVTGFDDLRRQAVREGTDREWRDNYGITARGRDNWNECVAENFVAWSVGRTDLMNPKMVEMFDLIAKQGLEQRARIEGAGGG